jgi:glycyl-tRNA synthetase beta subunit
VAISALDRVFASRYASLLPDVRYDILEAALTGVGPELTLPKSVRFRTLVLTRLVEDSAFVQTATRPINIVQFADRKAIEYGSTEPSNKVEVSSLDSQAGLELFEVVAEQEGDLRRAVKDQDLDEVVRRLRSLADPINRYFESTMVLIEDQPQVRFARLTLAYACASQLFLAGDFSKIVVEGVN